MPDYIVNIAFNPTLQSVGNLFSDPGIEQELHNILTEYAFQVERFSKQVTPVDTGRLRASIGTSFLVASGQKGGGIARVAPHTEYAGFVHEGTKFMKGRPFMRWGVEFAEQRMNGEIPDRLDKALRQKLSRLH